jgi:hypothetical protein
MRGEALGLVYSRVTQLITAPDAPPFVGLAAERPRVAQRCASCNRALKKRGAAEHQVRWPAESVRGRGHAAVPRLASRYDRAVHSRDTSAEAAAIQHEAYRRIGSVGRFNIAAELTNVVRELARAGIRKRHPEYSSEQVSKELARYIYPLNTARED